jgi:hypothetical protein
MGGVGVRAAGRAPPETECYSSLPTAEELAG